jgi:hypothetical protein
LDATWWQSDTSQRFFQVYLNTQKMQMVPFEQAKTIQNYFKKLLPALHKVAPRFPFRGSSAPGPASERSK